LYFGDYTKCQETMPVDAQLENLPKPKIVIEQDWIYLSDRVIPWRIFLTLFCAAGTAFSVWRGVQDNEMMILVTGTGTFGFLYGSLSLYRIKIDLKNKVMHRTSINPLANLIDRILQHPADIPFANIEAVYSGKEMQFSAAAVTRHYLYIRTDDPYALKIGIFNTVADAELCAAFLWRKIRA
jgi:hypothetical protein